MTLLALYEEGKEELLKAGVPDAGLDARLLLQETFSLDLSAYLLTRGGELAADDGTQARIALYRKYIKERAARRPLSQILGKADFMGLTFSVTADVLTPRQDTETLAEQVLADFAESGPARSRGAGKAADLSLLDLCTGSGCLAVSLAVKGPFSRVAATDISGAALAVARENALRYGLSDLAFYRGDLFDALPPACGAFTVITANPPYIPTAEIGGLMPEVRDYEPRTALDGAEDGLIFYRRIAAGAKENLAPGGRLYLEIGYDQAEAVTEIFKRAGYGAGKIVKDPSGNDRVAVIDGP